MNMQSLNLGKAFSLMMRTSPIILIRLGANLLFWLVAIIYFLVVGAVAALIANAVPFLGFIIFLVAIVGLGGLYHLAYKYVFYMLKAAHIAVLSDLLEHDKLKSNKGQLGYGKQRVEERFGELNAMFVVDELVAGVVRSFTRTVYRLTAFAPSDAIRTLVKVVNRIIYFATNYIDEAILARSFYEPTDDIWGNARDGVVLYGMRWKPILMNAIVLMVLSYVPFIVAFVLFSLPVGLLLATISPQLAGWSLIFLLLLSWLIKVAIGDSFAMTAIIATYHRETRSLEPNPEMAAKLDSVSDSFQDLTARARENLGFGGQKKESAQPDSGDNPTTAPQPGN